MNKHLVTVQMKEGTYAHFPHTHGTYVTMCGLDGDDIHDFNFQKVVPTPIGAMVNCTQCIAIWVAMHDYSRDSISWSMYNELHSSKTNSKETR